MIGLCVGLNLTNHERSIIGVSIIATLVFGSAAIIFCVVIFSILYYQIDRCCNQNPQRRVIGYVRAVPPQPITPIEACEMQLQAQKLQAKCPEFK